MYFFFCTISYNPQGKKNSFKYYNCFQFTKEETNIDKIDPAKGKLTNQKKINIDDI